MGKQYNPREKRRRAKKRIKRVKELNKSKMVKKV